MSSRHGCNRNRQGKPVTVNSCCCGNNRRDCVRSIKDSSPGDCRCGTHPKRQSLPRQPSSQIDSTIGPSLCDTSLLIQTEVCAWSEIDRPTSLLDISRYEMRFVADNLEAFVN